MDELRFSLVFDSIQISWIRLMNFPTNETQSELTNLVKAFENTLCIVLSRA